MTAINVLNALDKTKTSLYHFTAVLVAGMGFFTDAYDLFCIATVTKLLGRLYYYDPLINKPGVLPVNVAAAVNGVALCGTLAGQLFFGWLGDKLGRKKVYGVTLLIMIVCSVCSGLSFGHTANGVMTTLCFFRFWLGFGIGGDYPLSATIMSEYANKKTRGAFIAAVFAMQGVGILTAAAVAIAVSSIFKAAFERPAFLNDPVRSTPPEADFVWRIILMLGALPALLTFYWRMQMPETARYTALVQKNAERAATDMSKVLQMDFTEADATLMTRGGKEGGGPDEPKEYGLFSGEFARRHGLQLLGTTSTWFLLDIAFYSQNLFQKDVFTAVGWLPAASRMSAIDEVYRIARAQALIALVSTVPGYWATVFTVDWLGRKTIQLQGFFFMTLSMAILAGNYTGFRGEKCADDPSKFCGGNHLAFVALYALTFFFANFGPNSTTFIIPAELFPARLRSTCHGISAAAGKAGAIVGAFGFLYASQSTDKRNVEHGYSTGIGLQSSLMVLAITNGLGLFFTFLVPETNGKSLEELSGEAEAMGMQHDGEEGDGEERMKDMMDELRLQEAPNRV
eukprot:jgi/Mesen1/2473/ME000158S01668